MECGEIDGEGVLGAGSTLTKTQRWKPHSCTEIFTRFRFDAYGM